MPVLLFTGCIALPAIFLTPGAALYGPITTQGVRTASLLLLRAETCVSLSTLLVLTTRWAHILKALRVLRMPVVFVVILGMTYRYLFVILETALDMFESRKSRTVGVLEGADRRRLATATVGVLLSKSYHLSTDVHLAMQSRGFRGEVYMLDDFEMQASRLGLAAALFHGRRDGGLDGALMFRVENVTFRYGPVVALDNVSLEIQEGRRSALLGANGSGKSTLLRMLDGLCFPDSGEVSFRDESIDAAGLEDDRFAMTFRRRVGLVFQNPDVQLFNPTVFDEVAFGPLQMRWPKAEILRARRTDS